MLVATIKYDLFQRADVLHAAESPDALRPALKDSAERVITHSACKCRAEIIRRVGIGLGLIIKKDLMKLMGKVIFILINIEIMNQDWADSFQLIQ